MTISSYFYDSVNGDRTYSAADFARAFEIGFENGVLLKEVENELGFEIGGTNYLTVYDGKAIIEGHFIEVTGTETLTVPAGDYSGQVVIQLDATNTRTAKLLVKTNQTPIKTTDLYELPLYNCTVTGGIITTVTDVRTRGGASPNDHLHPISDITNLQSHINSALTWVADPNGVKCIMGRYAGTGKNVVLFLTSGQPSASSTEHRVWIQIDNF